MWTFVFFALAYLKVPAESLKDLRVHIPETVIRGSNAVFNCTFNFDEDETLYAIKWYRGTYEIFRYIPSDMPQLKRFPLSGYNVSMQRSNGNTMVLDRVDFINSGAYSCEVIADQTFHTLIETKHMLVIDLPDKKPSITGLPNSMKAGVGDGVDATCTSWQSNPPANLSWFINGEPASDKYLNRHTVREEYDGTFTSVLGLDITSLEKYHFINGKVTLKCTSSMLSVYWQSHQVQIKESTPHQSQISDLVRGGKGQKNRSNRNKIKQEKRKNRPSFPNRSSADGKNMNTENVRQGSTNNKNNKVEGLTHHVLSSSTKMSSNVVVLPLDTVIQMLLNKISIPHFVVVYIKFSEHLFWALSAAFLATNIYNV